MAWASAGCPEAGVCKLLASSKIFIVVTMRWYLPDGTTLIAAETTGRTCLGIELNPVYVDVAVERWQNLTGGVAMLEGDGRAFTEIAGERSSASPAPRNWASSRWR